MKKIAALLVTFMMLTLAFAGTAGAAAQQQKTIRVWMEDQELTFDVPPLVQDGTTYVEFRGLFTALGFQVAYDSATKTITGVSSKAQIQMKIGSSETLVNGKPALTKVQPLAVNGRTLIPLRFIGEATGLLVDWNQADKTIKLSRKGPSAEELASLKAMFDEQSMYELNGDVEGLLSTIDPKSPLYAAYAGILPDEFSKVKVHTQYEIASVVDYQPDSAVLIVNQKSEKVSGGFYLNKEAQGKLTLTKAADGKWKLYTVETLQLQYPNADAVLSKEAANVPAADKEQIMAVIDQQMKASNEEDLDSYEATIDQDLPNRAETLEAVKQVFDVFDLKYTMEKESIVDFTDNEAVVYAVQTTEKIKGPDYPNNRAYVVLVFKKTADGKWVSTSGAQIIKVEAL